MKFHQLIYFLQTARTEHIGKAAKILAISPSAISHSIAALEEELGRQLFAKQGKNIFLTSHGKLLLERVEKLLNEIETIKEEISHDQVELQGTYRLAGSHLISHALLAPVWAGIQNRNPRLMGELFTLRSAQVLQGVIHGEYDFGLCFSPQSHSAVHLKTLYAGELVVALRRNHPFVRGRKREPISAISRYPATLPKSYQGIDNCESHPIFERFGISPQVDLIFDNYEVAVRKLELSDGWGFVPEWVAERAGLIGLKPEGWHAPVNITALWPRNRIMTRVLRQLVAGLEKELAVKTGRPDVPCAPRTTSPESLSGTSESKESAPY